MLCIAKKILQGIQALICVSFLLLSTYSVAQEKINLKEFNQVVQQVEELKKTDLILALKQLTAYQNLLNALTVEQNLIYFKLLAEIYIDQNKYNAAKKTASQGLVIAKRLASPSILISELLYVKGFAFESLGDISQAAKEYRKGLEVAESLYNKVQIADGLINLGAIAYLTEDFKRSLVLLNDAYNIAIQTDDEELKGTANSELGIVYSLLEQDQQSMAYYQQAYSHFKKAGLLRAAHTSLYNIAIGHITKKNYQQAIVVFNTILTESNKDSPSDSLFLIYSGMAWAYLKKEDSNADAAYEYLLMAKPYLQATEKRYVQVTFYYNEASILSKLERFNEALVSLSKVEEILATNQQAPLVNKQSFANLMNLKAKILNNMGQQQQAYKVISRVIGLTDKLSESEDNRSIAQVRLRLEGEQADRQSKALKNQSQRHEESLLTAKLENKQQRIYLIVSALFALAFAWVLVKLIQSQHKLKVASNIDTLTGVANRRRLMKKSQQAFKLATAKGSHLSLLMIDIDNFKVLNERLGHGAGDKILAQLASLGANMMRKSDVFGRFGGEEFMVCLPKASLDSAMNIAERLRLAVNQHHWQGVDLAMVNISIGVATLTDDKDLLSLIKRTEEQLYHAKASGRDKVCGQ